MLLAGLCACSGAQTQPTTAATSLNQTTTAATTTTTTRPATTEPPVSMPDDNTAWANYIVDENYNYIADRLTKTQKTNVGNMCAAVGCKVVFEESYTKVTDAKRNVVYYSKDFGDDTIIAEPQFGVLTLAKRAGSETVFVYKGATILNFISYIERVENDGFSYYAVNSINYLNGEGIFVGSDENGSSVIIQYTGNMIVIALTEVE